MNEPDDRPWERPGAVRRDAEPHRGGLLFLLATVPTVGGFLGFPATGFATATLPSARDACFLTMLGLSGAALLLALSVRQMARGDLCKMRAGLMDPRGQALTQEAKDWNLSGLLLNLELFLFAAVVVGVRLAQ